MAHEPLDAVLPAVADVAHAGANDRLQVEGQPVLGAPGDVVQVEAHGPQEVPGPPAVLGFLVGEDAAAGAFGTDQLAHHLGAEHVARHPVKRLHVAQAAAAFLDVGFDQERRFAIAVVAGVALRLLGRDEAAGAGVGAGLLEARLERFEQPSVAGQQPRVQQRGAHGEVTLRFGEALRDRARRVADLEAEVPEEVQHELDHGERRRGGAVRGDEQEVDVAERRQHAAPVAAGGDDGHAFGLGRVRTEAGRDGGAGVVAQRPDHAVRQPAQQASGLQPAHAPGLEPLLHVVLHPGQVAAEHAERGVARGRPAAGRGAADRRGQQRNGFLGPVRQGQDLGHQPYPTPGCAGGTAASALRR